MVVFRTYLRGPARWPAIHVTLPVDSSAWNTVAPLLHQLTGRPVRMLVYPGDSIPFRVLPAQTYRRF
jgi:hypothetical protein